MLDELDGRRVALRHRIAPDGAPGPRLSDAVGELAGDGPDAVVVHTRSGPVRVLRDAVVAVREVPPAPARRASRAAVAHLDRVRSDAWPAPVRAGLGRWLLRAAGGGPRRANSALADGDPGLPVPQALQRVRAFSAAHGIDPVVQCPAGSPWSRRVRDAGWRVRGGEGLVLVAPAGPDDDPPDWPATPPPGWWDDRAGPAPAPGSAASAALLGTAGGGRAPGPAPGAPDPAPYGYPTAVAFGLADSPDGPVAGVRVAVVEDHVHLSRLHTGPAQRDPGPAALLVRRALAWGAARGARHAVLDLAAGERDTGTGPPGGLKGWTEHHRYHYLAPPD